MGSPGHQFVPSPRLLSRIILTMGKALKEAAQDKENAFTNKLTELNDILKARDDEILQFGKKIMHVENDLDSTTEKLLKATLDIEQAEKDQHGSPQRQGVLCGAQAVPMRYMILLRG